MKKSFSYGRFFAATAVLATVAVTSLVGFFGAVSASLRSPETVPEKQTHVFRAPIERPKPPSIVVQDAAPVAREEITKPQVQPVAPEAPAVVEAVIPVNTKQTVTLKRGQTVRTLLKKQGLKGAQLKEVVRAFNRVYLASNLLKPGQAFEIERTPAGKLVQVSFVKKGTNEVVSIFQSEKGQGEDKTFEAKVSKLQVKVERSLLCGTVSPSHNLFNSIVREGGGKAVAAQFTTIFTQADLSNVLPNDSFEIIVEREKREKGGYANDGTIVFAQIKTRGKTLKAYRVTYLDGMVSDYVDENGQSLKSVLRRPNGVETSGFSSNRFHPIKGYSRAHEGIDYAADAGTPIPAATEGRVLSKGWVSGYGNTIVLDHGGGVTTLYGHMLKPSALPLGQRVEEGQTIGLVGSTGDSTGNHVHFEVRVDGRAVNPEELVVRGALAGVQKKQFLKDKGYVEADLTHLNEQKVLARAVIEKQGGPSLGLMREAMKQAEDEVTRKLEAERAFLRSLGFASKSSNVPLLLTPAERASEVLGLVKEEERPSVRKEDLAKALAEIFAKRQAEIPSQTIEGHTIGGVQLAAAAPVPLKIAERIERNDLTAGVDSFGSFPGSHTKPVTAEGAAQTIAQPVAKEKSKPVKPAVTEQRPQSKPQGRTFTAQQLVWF